MHSFSRPLLFSDESSFRLAQGGSGGALAWGQLAGWLLRQCQYGSLEAEQLRGAFLEALSKLDELPSAEAASAMGPALARRLKAIPRRRRPDMISWITHLQDVVQDEATQSFLENLKRHRALSSLS